MDLEGTVQNGVIVPEGECTLPEGTKVRITPSQADRLEASPTIWEKLRQLAEKYESLPCDLPSDLSINHDHYLYGTPKQQP